MAGIRNLLLSMSRGGGAGAIVTPFNTGALDSQSFVGTAQATAVLTFKPDGSVSSFSDPFYDPDNNDIDNGVTGPNYYDPPSSGIGAGYWLLVKTPASGTFTSGTVGTRQQMNVDRQYTATTTGTTTFRKKYVRADFEIWTAATGGTLVSSGTITLTAIVDNTV